MTSSLLHSRYETSRLSDKKLRRREHDVPNIYPEERDTDVKVRVQTTSNLCRVWESWPTSTPFRNLPHEHAI